MKDAGNPYELHRTLARAFGAGDEYSSARVLFRIEDDVRDKDGVVVLVQSLSKPDWAALRAWNDYLVPGPDGAKMRPLIIADINAGDRFRFRLRANPTKRVPGDHTMDGNGKMKDGPLIGLLTDEAQLAWLIRRSECHGFRLVVQGHTGEGMPSFAVSQRNESEVRSAGKDKRTLFPQMVTAEGHRATFASARFDGELKVTDPDAFRKAVYSGVGRGKAFGFGLLSVARAG
jgi:CRISPR system Cascade subunit CasE